MRLQYGHLEVYRKKGRQKRGSPGEAAKLGGGASLRPIRIKLRKKEAHQV